jgi:hypothetical protein
MAAAPFAVDPDWAQYGTPRQVEILAAVILHGSNKKAADALGMARQNVDRVVHKLRARALLAMRQAAVVPKGTAGFVALGLTTAYDAAGAVKSEFLREGPAPVFEPGGEGEGPARDGTDGYFIKGVSTYYRGDGSQGGQWVKTKADEEQRLQAIMAAIASASAKLPRLVPLRGPLRTLRSLLNLYVFTDYHLGMRAWSEEGGADWNMQIAEDLIVRCFQQMVADAPAARVGFIAQLGDFLHFDSLLPMTPTSGHVVDAAAHYEQIIDAALRIMRRLIDFALQHHEEVVVLAAEGNHDITGSMWLRVAIKALYENEPRITVVRAAAPFYAYEHGKTMLSFHHGHLVKKESLPLTFAAAYAPMWGRTTKRYAHCGHYHHEVTTKEESGMRVHQHPTLAPNDSHSARHGYFSQRQTSVTTYDERFGEVGKATLTPEMLADAI